MGARENFDFSLIFIIKMTYSLINFSKDLIDITLIRILIRQVEFEVITLIYTYCNDYT